MRKCMKQALGLSMTAVMALGTVGCGAETKAPEATQEAAKEVVQDAVQKTAAEAEVAESQAAWTSDDSAEIVIMVGGDNTVNEENMVIEEIEKRTNTNIRILYVPLADVPTKLNTLIAAEDMPDLFYIKASDALDLKEAGMLADVGPVMKAIAPNVMKETEGLLEDMALNKDGIFMIPNTNVEDATNLVIRQDWLDNLGLAMPTDLESFAKVMHAFTYDDPDQNGVDDTFGLSCSLATTNSVRRCFDSIFGAYGIAKGRAMQMEDGTVTTWVKHPHFLEAITYIKGLFADGVCEPDYISIPNMAMFEKFWNGTSGSMEWECAGPTNNWMPGRYTDDPVPELGFAVLEGPYGDSGVSALYVDNTQGWVVSSQCENMEGVARIANYLMTEEGSDLLYLGIEGVMYNWVDKENGVIERLGEFKDDATHRANGAFCYHSLFKPKSTAQLRTMNKQTQEGVQLAHANSIDWCNVIEVSEVYMNNGADMDQLINEMIAELMTADMADIESIYEEYIAEWESLGGTDWEIEITELWNAQNQ